MNSKFTAALVVAAAALGSASSFAYGSNDLGPAAFPALRSSQSTVTRAHVRNETAAQRAVIPAVATSPDAVVVAQPTAKSNVTRAEVRAEARKELRGERYEYEANL